MIPSADHLMTEIYISCCNTGKHLSKELIETQVVYNITTIRENKSRCTFCNPVYIYLHSMTLINITAYFKHLKGKVLFLELDSKRNM